MREIATIYVRDMLRVMRHWAALVVVLGLVVLPSLYAWFNIAASWDPYGQTNRLPVAVASNDTGAALRGLHLNIGHEIINALKHNHQIDWQFVDATKAVDGVRYGDYYACIIIPFNFSSKIATVLTHNPEQAQIEYYVNEKINAVAPKITMTGASDIVHQVSQRFIQTANGAIFRIFNQIGVQLRNDRPTIEQLITLIFKLDAMTPEINQAVNTALRDVTASNDIVRQAQADLPLVAQIAQDGANFSSQLTRFLDSGAQTMASLTPSIKQNLLLLQQVTATTDQLSNLLNEPIQPSAVTNVLGQNAAQLGSAIDVTKGINALLVQIGHLSTGGAGQNNTIQSNTIQRLQQSQNNLIAEQSIVKQLASSVNHGQKPSPALVALLSRLSQQTSGWTSNLVNGFDTDIGPRLSQGFATASSTVQHAHAAFVGAEQAIPDVQRILNDATKGLAIGQQQLLTAQHQLPTIEAKIHDLANGIRTLEKQGSISDLIQLLTIPAGQESSFFAQPVTLKENRMYPIPNYGSAMSPFFTTLSLWVGTLLLVSLLTVDVPDQNAGFKSHHVYFGRYLSFLTFSVLQSLLVTLGDIFMLHTYVVDKPWFILFGMVISAVFMLIVYTLVSIFGNAGKALAIVLLVLQLAGSGGTFPIQTTPPFFQAIHPFLPFTYAISMMREAVGGTLWGVVRSDLWIMCAYVVLTLAIGLALKKWINQATVTFVKNAKASKLIH